MDLDLLSLHYSKERDSEKLSNMPTHTAGEQQSQGDELSVWTMDFRGFWSTLSEDLFFFLGPIPQAKR